MDQSRGYINYYIINLRIGKFPATSIPNIFQGIPDFKARYSRKSRTSERSRMDVLRVRQMHKLESIVATCDVLFDMARLTNRIY